MRRPHAPQKNTPASSQYLYPAAAGRWLPFIASRAASTSSRGTPMSGTGTAIHSGRGFSCTFWRQ